MTAVTSDRSPEKGTEHGTGGALARSVMIGAEMLNWSDLHPDDGRPASGGPVPAALLAAVLVPSDSVLMVGPQSLELIEQVAGLVTSVDVLVRSAPDAEEIADQVDERPVRVFCGGLDRFGPDHGKSSYDVVVALDGLPRLVGPDTPVLTWADALAALQARLAPDGRLVVAADNAFGIERLIQPAVTDTVPRDDAWPRDVAGAVEAPTGLKAVWGALEAAGLSVMQTYAVYPELIEAKVALAKGVLTAAPRGGGGAAAGGTAAGAGGSLGGVVAARAVAERYSGATLMDPYRVVQDAVAAGLGDELAPAWYFVTAPAEVAAEATERTGELPEVLPGELPQLLPGADIVPAGPGVLLEESLLAALRIDDQAALRRTVPGYVSWLLAAEPGVAAVASPDNLLADGTSYRVFSKDSAAVAGSGEALAVAQLARFVRRSLEAGSRQPWAAGSSPHDLTARLASMAGITMTAELWAPVADGNESAQPTGHAEQLATIARLSQELADANTQASWFESQLDGIRRSRPYRIGQAVLNPARVVVKRIRRVKR